MEIFISAGEVSSDIHGAHLLNYLKKKIPNLKAYGLGGEKLVQEGITLLEHNKNFSVGGGPLEIISKVFLRSKFEQGVADFLSERKIKLAVLIDNGEINLRIASLFHFYGIPVVYYIPPKIWVWRFSRIEKIAQHCTKVLGILPFEEEIFKLWDVPFEYVGNPLLNEVDLNLTQSQAKLHLGISDKEPVLTMLPGSRKSEIKFHVPLFVEALKLFLQEIPKEKWPRVIVPATQTLEANELEQEFKDEFQRVSLPEIKFNVVQGQSHYCLKAATVALIKSGTSTLEAALLGVPHLLVYKVSRSAHFVYRFIVRYSGFVGLVNLILAKDWKAALGVEGKEVPLVPELILNDANPERLAKELKELYLGDENQDKMRKAFARLPELLFPSKFRNKGIGSPIEAAAESCIEILKKQKVE
jgi:lipid-A-disaccharide synthase